MSETRPLLLISVIRRRHLGAIPNHDEITLVQLLREDLSFTPVGGSNHDVMIRRNMHRCAVNMNVEDNAVLPLSFPSDNRQCVVHGRLQLVSNAQRHRRYQLVLEVYQARVLVETRFTVAA